MISVPVVGCCPPQPSHSKPDGRVFRLRSRILNVCSTAGLGSRQASTSTSYDHSKNLGNQPLPLVWETVSPAVGLNSKKERRVVRTGVIEPVHGSSLARGASFWPTPHPVAKCRGPRRGGLFRERRRFVPRGSAPPREGMYVDYCRTYIKAVRGGEG